MCQNLNIGHTATSSEDAIPHLRDAFRNYNALQTYTINKCISTNT